MTVEDIREFKKKGLKEIPLLGVGYVDIRTALDILIGDDGGLIDILKVNHE